MIGDVAMIGDGDAAESDPAGTVWWGWGSPEAHAPLPDPVRSLLEEAFGAGRRDTPPVGFDAVRLPAGTLPRAARDALVGVVGTDWVQEDAASRVRHCRGRSTVDLLRLRAGDALDAPDAVVVPSGHDEVLAVLRACVTHRVAVVPFGGGTSVVGGLAAARGGYTGLIALDLARMNRLVAVDTESAIATCEPGLRGPMLETALAAHGLTLGHLPQSWEYATVGGFAATRSCGQASAGYGRFDSLVMAVRMATPAGTWDLGRAPASAAGPDLRQLVLGSEGVFGVVTQVRLRVRPVPESTVYEGWHLPDFTGAVPVLRAMAQAEVPPTVVRLSDEVETAVGYAAAGAGTGADTSGGCQLILGFEGRAGWMAARHAEVADMLTSAGGVALGPAPGREWARDRFQGPYLRDALLDVGMFVETLETAGFWSTLPGLYADVRAAIASALATHGVPGLVMCHVSHLYPTGASLYFTVVYGRADDPTADATRWREVKAAASAAIIDAGATITHHHATGTDHRPWLPAEIGELGVAVLRAVKESLDPTGILNPGILLP